MNEITCDFCFSLGKARHREWCVAERRAAQERAMIANALDEAEAMARLLGMEGDDVSDPRR